MGLREQNLVEKHVADIMRLCQVCATGSSSKDSDWRNYGRDDPQQRAYNALYVLWVCWYQLLHHERAQQKVIEARIPEGGDEARDLARLLVDSAVKTARADLADGLAFDIGWEKWSWEELDAIADKAVLAIEEYFKTSSKLDDDLHLAAAATQSTSRNIIFNSAAFKRMPTGKHGEKNFGAAGGITLQYILSQKKASRNGAAKKPTFAINLSDVANEEQARMFSHCKYWETALTEPSSRLTVSLVVKWENGSIHFPGRTIVEARADVEATDLGDLVALAVIFKNHAEQEVIDGGWPGDMEERTWETGYPDIKSTVQYRRLG